MGHCLRAGGRSRSRSLTQCVICWMRACNRNALHATAPLRWGGGLVALPAVFGRPPRWSHDSRPDGRTDDPAMPRMDCSRPRIPVKGEIDPGGGIRPRIACSTGLRPGRMAPGRFGGQEAMSETSQTGLRPRAAPDLFREEVPARATGARGDSSPLRPGAPQRPPVVACRARCLSGPRTAHDGRPRHDALGRPTGATARGTTHQQGS